MEDKISNLFREKSLVKICAPMVRYSKLEFRTLVRKYGCDLCYTPMIMAESFISSEKARQVEFQTRKGDTPLIVQFAARTPDDFVSAAELVSPFCDGVDLNCGCPQKWALKDGYGADLLTKPYLIHDMLRQVRNRTSVSKSVSVKIRVLEDMSETLNLCRNLEAAGISFLTVHGRTPRQRSDPVNTEALKTISETIQIPLVANGDVKSLQDTYKMQEITGCKGVMCARGLLQNPALFSGVNVTPLSCVQDWLDICSQSRIPFQWFHHHLVFMLEKVLKRSKRRVFNNLSSVDEVLTYLGDNLGFELPVFAPAPDFYSEVMYKNDHLDDGSYFKAVVKDNCVMEDYMEGSYIYLG